MRVKAMAALASLVLLTSCDSATGVVNLGGLITFTYSSSDLSGDYSANGAMPAAPIDQHTNGWAASDLGTNTVFTTSMQPRGTSTHDLSILTIRRQTAGTETLTAGCSSNCSRLYIMFGAPNAGSGGLFLQECTMTVGTITVASISATRVSGTFSGTGTCSGALGGSTAFTVTNGSFDTAILPNV